MKTTSPTVQILVSSSDQQAFEKIKQLLDVPQFKISWVANLADLETASAGPGPCIIVLDLSAQRNNIGLIFKNLQLWGTKTPIIALIDQVDEEMAFQAFKSGAQDFLVKEYLDTELLLRTLRHSLLRYNLTAQRKDVEKQFWASQKMESIGRLAGGIAHDFNNLLTVIINYSLLLSESFAKDDPRRERVESISQAAYRAADLTKQLLAFSRKQVLKPQEMDLNLALTGLDQMLGRVIGEDIDLVINLQPNLGRIKADPTQIIHVVTNLAVNARDAMPGGGKLVVETKSVNLSGDDVARHHGLTPGQYVLLTVSDSGVGMDAETQERIFEPFFTTKGVGAGSGLGLAAVYGIVKQSGGHVTVYSEIGQGTVFKVYFPRCDEPRHSIQGREMKSENLSGKETILLVEDEDIVRTVASDILRKQGYEVIEAQDASGALKICDDGKTKIDLVLTDLIMPKMNGPELVKALKTKFSKLSVVYMSGYTENFVHDGGQLEAGAQFVQKPFMPKTLLGAVRQALASEG